LDQKGARELDERSCPGRASRPGLRLPPGRAGGMSGIRPAEFYDLARILEADAVEGDDK